MQSVEGDDDDVDGRRTGSVCTQLSSYIQMYIHG